MHFPARGDSPRRGQADSSAGRGLLPGAQAPIAWPRYVFVGGQLGKLRADWESARAAILRGTLRVARRMASCPTRSAMACRTSAAQPLDVEEHIQAANGPAALEYGGAGLGVEVEPIHGLAGAARAGDLDPRRPRSTGH